MFLHIVGGSEHELKAEIDKINTGNSYYDLAGDHHTSADDTIDEIHQRNLGIGIRPSLCRAVHVAASLVAASASLVKLYAGQGPLTSTDKPLAEESSAISPSSAVNRAWSARPTR